MPLWRREEPLHERLRREGALDAAERVPLDTSPRWGEVGIHGRRKRVEGDSEAG